MNWSLHPGVINIVLLSLLLTDHTDEQISDIQFLLLTFELVSGKCLILRCKFFMPKYIGFQGKAFKMFQWLGKYNNGNIETLRRKVKKLIWQHMKYWVKMLIMQQMIIFWLRNIWYQSVWTLDKQTIN